jgi:hypothetical protein
MNFPLESRLWWDYLEEDLQELLRESVLLVEIVEKWKREFHDYAFIVFPAAKAYEGFLKTLFLDLGLITKRDFYGKRFRVGKALNPALDKPFRKKEGVYDRLVSLCGGRELADTLWDTWKRCRNLLFHWFPDEKNVISFEDSKQRLAKVLGAMDLAFKECRTKIQTGQG